MWFMATLIEPLLLLTCITHTGSSLLTQRINSLPRQAPKRFGFLQQRYNQWKWTPLSLCRRSPLPPNVPVDFCRVGRIGPVGAPAHCAPGVEGNERQGNNKRREVARKACANNTLTLGNCFFSVAIKGNEGPLEHDTDHLQPPCTYTWVLLMISSHAPSEQTKKLARHSWFCWCEDESELIVQLKWWRNKWVSQCRVHTLQGVVVCRSPSFYIFWRHCVFLMLVST